MQDLNQLVIYEVYVRNHVPNGTFADVVADLPRIRQMGVDVVWLMPIHPIGAVARKGTLGSPYAIADYRAVNPEFGTLDDFRNLIAAAHAQGLKLWIDVVYNHTAHDAWTIDAHPEWYHLNADGKPQTLVPEWSDVIDLNHDVQGALWDYLIAALVQWTELGVDGFRCDVASVVPLAFWERARAACAAVNPDVVWLAESVHVSFVNLRRSQGRTGHADAEMYRAFDLTYDYDIWEVWRAVVAGREKVSLYLDMLRLQGGAFPAHAVKMRCVENHDQARIMAETDRPRALAWTAFQAFNQGALLLYAGQESAATHTPSLFESDPIDWGDYELQPYLMRLIAIKRRTAGGRFVLLTAEPVLAAAWHLDDETLVGLFNVQGNDGRVSLALPDGDYRDLITDATVSVRNGEIDIPQSAVILAVPGVVALQPYSGYFG